MTETAIENVRPGPLALPSFVDQSDRSGKENVRREDIQIPRLSLAQALSPEIQEGDPKHIPGLKFGDAYNNLTKVIYGREPLTVVIVRAEPVRHIEFFPRETGGGIKDMNVGPNDPRTRFTTNEKTGESVKPLATRFLEFVALLGPDREPIALSFKGAGLKTAKTINGLVAARKGPAFASKFVLTPATEKNGKGTFAVFNVAFAGNVDEETYLDAKNFFENIKEQKLETEREADDHTGDPDKVPF